jgi:outer membrane protein W
VHYNFKLTNIEMKKIYLLLAIMFCSISVINAQTLSIGPVAGINASKFSSSNNSENKIGLSLGAFANYSVNEHLGINAKLLFSERGSNYSTSNASVRLKYIQMPISLIYYFGEIGQKLRPKVYAGPYFGTLFSAIDQNKNDIIDANGNDVFKKLDIGGQIGLGFNYSLKSRTWLNLDLGYGQSFTDITESDATNEHNKAFLISVGISFPIVHN